MAVARYITHAYNLRHVGSEVEGCQVQSQPWQHCLKILKMGRGRQLVKNLLCMWEYQF